MVDKKDNNASKRIVPLFREYYEGKHDREYHVNWPVIKSSEKVAQYYTIKEVRTALNYYFSSSRDHNLWEFIDGIAAYLESAEAQSENEERLKEKIEKTKARVKSFEP
jgi:hypothetical protein